MKILVTNDDGIESAGILELVKGISSLGEIYVVAPDRKLSGIGGGVTFDRPIKVEKVSLRLGEERAFKVCGTPSDCVILALDILIKDVDLVISGINDEPNVGDDIRFSGTIGACREAAFSGIPALGISLEYGTRGNFYEGAVEFSKYLLRFLEKNNLPEGVILNINVPNVPMEEIQGVKFVKLGRRKYKDRVHIVLDPYGKEYYWIGGTLIEDWEEETENSVLKKNYIAITPLNIEETDYKFLEVMKQWKMKFP
jgi:5'-nucleotidase